MNLNQLNNELNKLKSDITKTFLLDGKELDNALENSTLTKKIKTLENSEQHKIEVANQRNKIDTKVATKNANKLTTQSSNTDATDKAEQKFTTKSASKEIQQLLGAMISRKQITNRIRGLDVHLETEKRHSVLVVESIKLFKLSVDGNGSMVIFVDKSDIGKKIFKFILLPLLSSLDDYLGGLGISISNVKDSTKTMAFNPEKQLYVSSPQIKNKPVRAGQSIIFTNLKKGRFTVK